MKLQQLRYICEVARCGLNVTDAAANLYTSQPGISKQIRLLEEELGVLIFKRSGKHFVDITPAGRAIIKRAEQVLLDVRNIKELSQEFADQNRGSLSIATTHTQACYALPPTIQTFRGRYPDVSLHIHQGTPMQIAEQAARGEVDFSIATEALELFEDLVTLPCYHWNRCIVAPVGHPLLGEPVTLETLAKYPLVTYVYGFTGRSKLDQAFADKGLTPNVVFTATDSTTLKTYARLGVGVGIMAKMAYDPAIDKDLGMVDASPLFESSTSHIAFRRGVVLRRYMYDFIQWFAPHLTRELVDAAMEMETQQERDRMFAAKLPELPVR
ncbi:MAG: HTH-type transcriptional regulator CysB [Gammaproteobacteria bacterium]|nr:HTH-type transcriptional regulator CysB [Gammaproteobacteria bacterium]